MYDKNKFNRDVQNRVPHEGVYLRVQTPDGRYFIPDSRQCIQPGMLARMGALPGPVVFIDTNDDFSKYEITTYGRLQR